MLITETEKARGYSDKTHELILEMERVNLSQDLKLNKRKVEVAIRKAYRIAELPLVKISWKEKIDEEFVGAARAAGAAGAARAAWAARAARAAGAAWAARAAWAAWAARAAWAAGIDYDFDYFINEFEFLRNEKGNENDRKALAIYKQFWIARRNGLGYLTEQGGKAILVPAPVVQWSENHFHSTTKPAIAWKGDKHYFLHGVKFGKELWDKIVSGKISAVDVLRLENIEQRYAALKTLGAEKLLHDLNAQLIDSSERGNELWKLRDVIPEKELKLLKYVCPSTNRTYTKFVPNEMTKADEAQAWSFQLTLEQYGMLKIES